MTERLRGRAAVAQRKRRMARTYGLCELCDAKGLTRVATVVDHIIALKNGGSDEDANTQNLCAECHYTKTREDFGQVSKPKPTIGMDGWPIAP